MTMITPSYLGETIEYSSLHACRSTLEDPTGAALQQHGMAHAGDFQDGHGDLSRGEMEWVWRDRGTMI